MGTDQEETSRMPEQDTTKSISPLAMPTEKDSKSGTTDTFSKENRENKEEINNTKNLQEPTTGEDKEKNNILKPLGKNGNPSEPKHNKIILFLYNLIYKPSFTDWVIAAATIVMAFLSYLTWKEVHSSGEQTEKIVTAATEIQNALKAANTQNKTALEETIRQNKDSLKTTIEENEKSLKASLTQGEKALDASISASNLDQRAWLGVTSFSLVQFEQGKPIKIDIQVSNNGKTPALKVKTSHVFSSSKTLLTNPPDTWIKNLNLEERGAVPPQSQIILKTKYVIEPSTYESIQLRTKTMQIFGKIVYEDISGGENSTDFCFYMVDPSSKELVFCEIYNNMK